VFVLLAAGKKKIRSRCPTRSDICIKDIGIRYRYLYKYRYKYKIEIEMMYVCVYVYIIYT